MSNVHSWFRLSSIARTTSQASSDPPQQTPSRQVVLRPPTKQPSPPSPPRQPSSSPRQQTPPPPPPQERSPYHSPSSRHTSPPTPTKAKYSPLATPPRTSYTPPRQPPSPPRQPSSSPRQQTPPPPPPQERSPYHSPSSRHTSPPPTPIKAKSPLSTPPRTSYTPPPSPKEVQEALPPPRKPTSPQSPAHTSRSIKYEAESFRNAPAPRVLSPYTLPPSQSHSERETTQKSILTAEKTSQPHDPNHHNHQDNSTKKTHHQPYFSGTRVITIAGENKGAVMEVIQSPSTGGDRTHSSTGFNGAGEKGQRIQSSSDEGEGKKKTKNHKNNMDLPMKAFMNSNVQMINNSIVYNSTATHHDPGIHLKIYRKPGSGNVKDYGNNGCGFTN